MIIFKVFVKFNCFDIVLYDILEYNCCIEIFVNCLFEGGKVERSKVF